jgi:glycosyltransferase involved in cell wall biosynthesis
LKIENQKIAIFYDWINQWGGAERVLLDLLKNFPRADLLTFYYHYQPWLPRNIKIITPPFHLKKYDLVIVTSSYFGYLIPANIYYFHNINRYCYNTPLKFFDRMVLPKKRIYLCNSLNVQNKIRNHFGVNASVVYPGIDVNKFVPIKKPNKKYFLVVARLVPYKKIDQAITACQNLKQQLIVVGTGRQEKYLKQIANPRYIKFAGKVSETQLIKLYQNCRALLYPQIEDFGLTALEAQACGRPVIARSAGGALETITSQTGLFFDHDLTQAIQLFETKQFSSQKCRQNALRFSRESFLLNFKKHLL